MLHIVDIDGTNNDAAHGAYIVSWGPDAMYIEQPALPGGFTGGYVAHDPPKVPTSLVDASGSRGVIIDRVGIGGSGLKGYPHTYLHGINFQRTTDSAVVGTFDSDMSACLPVDPNTHAVSRTFAGFSIVHTMISNTGGQRLRFINNKSASVGFYVFADNHWSEAEIADIDISGFEVWIPEYAVSPSNNRRGCAMRHIVEQKAYRRLAVANFGVLGNVASTQPSGTALAFYAAPMVGTGIIPQRDLSVSTGWIEGAGGIEVVAGSTPGSLKEPLRRVLVDNVTVSIRRDRYLSGLSSQNLEVAAPWGQLLSPGLRLDEPGASIVVKGSSFVGQGKGPLAIWLPRRASGLRLQDNILAASYYDTPFRGLMASFSKEWSDAVPPNTEFQPGWRSWRATVSG